MPRQRSVSATGEQAKFASDSSLLALYDMEKGKQCRFCIIDCCFCISPLMLATMFFERTESDLLFPKTAARSCIT